MPFLLGFWLQAEPCAPGTDQVDNGEGFLYDYLFLAFSAAAVWMAGGVLLEPVFEGAHAATIFAALGLASAHFLNWLYCRHCNPDKAI
ncbi:MAG: hypothetical protein IT260_03130 [Saprospiraceae bacterium]|nr:hypothetical protein [Saprospiraceae bacterium]